MLTRSHFRSAFRPVLLTAAACVVGSIAYAVQSVPCLKNEWRWVDPLNGSDTGGNGTWRFPWKTLDKGLTEARTTCSPIERIYLLASAPVAPTNNGGSEPSNVFPLTVPDGVSIIGVASGTTSRPTIKIDEATSGTSTYSSSAFGTGSGTGPKPFLQIGRGTSISNVVFDGNPFRHTDIPTKRLSGISVTDASTFHIEDCDFLELFFGVYVIESGNAGTAAQNISNGSIKDCLFLGAGPLYAPDPTLPAAAQQDRGHAGLWLSVTGSLSGTDCVGTSTPSTELDNYAARLNISLETCIFERCHDGIETESSGAYCTRVDFLATTCAFSCNENGLEIVNDGATSPNCTMSLIGCEFLDNYNRPATEGGYNYDSISAYGEDPMNPGVQTGGTTAAIVHRGKTSAIHVRDSVFRNNSIGILAGSSATLDLGTSSSAGNNSFILDADGSGTLSVPSPVNDGVFHHEFYPETAVAIWLVNGAQCDAYDNRWILGNQTASSIGCPPSSLGTGCSAGEICGGSSGLNDPPPVVSAGISADRNFAISAHAPTGKIVVGTATCGLSACGSTAFPPCAGNAPTASCP